MKRILLFGFIVAVLWSCGIDDSLNDDFYFEILPVESASIPTEMHFGEVYTINYSYLIPSSCHIFNNLYWTHLDFLFLTENEINFVQIRHFLKDIVSLHIRKVTKYERI